MVIGNNKKLPQLTQKMRERESLPIHALIVSQTPGRLRFRVTLEYRQHQEIDRITKVLKERLEIYRVRTNKQSGSITIFYAKEHSNFEKIGTLLQNLGVIFCDIIPHKSMRNGQSEAAAEITSTLSSLNQQIKQATNDTVDLRFLIPFSFSVLAVRQLLFKGLLLEAIPWYVLAWYAFDSFIKLHYTSDL